MGTIISALMNLPVIGIPGAVVIQPRSVQLLSDNQWTDENTPMSKGKKPGKPKESVAVA